LVVAVAGPGTAAGGVWGIADGANGNGVGQQQGRPVRTIKRTDPSVPGLDSLSAFLSARLKDSSAIRSL